MWLDVELGILTKQDKYWTDNSSKNLSKDRDVLIYLNLLFSMHAHKGCTHFSKKKFDSCVTGN